MFKKPLLLVACGSSLSASTLVAGKLEKEAARRRFPLETHIGTIDCLAELIAAHTPAAVVVTSLGAEPQGVKVFSGVPFISTIGEEIRFEEIFNYLAVYLKETQNQAL